MTGLSVLRADEIREGLGFLDAVAVAVVIVMAVVVGVSLGANVLHLQDISAFRAALDGTVARHLDCISEQCFAEEVARAGGTYREPDSDVRVSGIPCAASILLIAEGLDHDRVVERAYYIMPLAHLMPQLRSGSSAKN